ncbi:MAG: hypothetical protein ACR2QM_02215 [Longimicrobiales bacterium]
MSGGQGYEARVRTRIARVRKRGTQAMALVGLITVVFTVFLVYVLVTAYRLENGEAVRAAWLGLGVIVSVNALSYFLYRSQRRVLDEAVNELGELIGEEAPVGET